MSKHVVFAVSEEIHSKMKMYLSSLEEKKTMKQYMTELLENDLANKIIEENKED